MYPNLKQIKKIENLDNFNAIPISLELYSDRRTPMEVLKILKNESSHCFLLESAERNKQWGRYTYLGYNPTLELTCNNNVLNIKENNLNKEKTVSHPGNTIREIINDYKSPKIENLPTFTGGLVGYFSYDYIKYAEPSLKLNHNNNSNFKDMDLMLFDKVIAFDNYKQKIIIMINIKTDNLEKNYKIAEKELKQIANLIINGTPCKPEILKLKSDFKELFSKKEYCSLAEKTKNYIKEGDIFQLVLSNRFEAKASGSLFDTYRELRTLNPSPYMFYLTSNKVEIIGASPETLVKLENNKVFTFPLAGTRPRGKNILEEEKLERELLADKKECAEHNMLVDLGRNDIGKICKPNSIKVDSYMSIQKLSHVMHIGSTVSGELENNKDAIDAIDAILPAGTLSGAPKLRACEIINELEKDKRDIYGGAIGYLDFSGNLDVCIAIRLAFKENDKIYVRSGAGIVIDSIPENEYQECKNKAEAVMQAIKTSNGGLENDFIN